MQRACLALCAFAALGCKRPATFGPVTASELASIDALCGSAQTPMPLNDGTAMVRCASPNDSGEYVELRYDKERNLTAYVLRAAADRMASLLADTFRPSLDAAARRALDDLLAYVRATDPVRPFPRITVEHGPTKPWYAGPLRVEVTATRPARDVVFTVTLDPSAVEVPAAVETAIEIYLMRWCHARGGFVETAGPDRFSPYGLSCKEDEHSPANADLSIGIDHELAFLSVDDMTRDEYLQLVDIALVPLLGDRLYLLSRNGLTVLAAGSDDMTENRNVDPSWPFGLEIERKAARPSSWILDATIESTP